MISKLQDRSVENIHIKTEKQKKNNSKESLSDTYKMVTNSKCIFWESVKEIIMAPVYETKRMARPREGNFKSHISELFSLLLKA